MGNNNDEAALLHLPQLAQGVRRGPLDQPVDLEAVRRGVARLDPAGHRVVAERGAPRQQRDQPGGVAQLDRGEPLREPGRRRTYGGSWR